MTFPEFYIMSMDYHPEGDKREAKKCGTTWHGESRKSPFTTTHTKRPVFDHLFRLDPEQFPNKQDLYKLDSVKFRAFLAKKGLSQLNVQSEQGAGKEFYWADVINLVSLIREFLNEENITIIEELSVDPYPLSISLSREERTFLANEDFEKDDVLFGRICHAFLPGKVPRRIQVELFDIFRNVCDSPDALKYRGIIQWPTGVGKTIGTLMLIVLASERCKTRGETYRGMFVSPKNDILNTISQHFAKLSEFGIAVYDGSNGKLSSLSIPINSHVLVYACQAALTNNEGMRKLPSITHFHYDEVHRITGEVFFGLLKEMLEEWNTEFLTGTSATPQTSSESQRSKLSDIFGTPYSIIHKCDVDEAVQEGWIARPRFMVDIIQKYETRTDELNAYLRSVVILIKKRKDDGLWKDGKIICYVSNSIQDVIYCIEHAAEFIPNAKVYGAVDGYRSDGAFVNAKCDGTIQILFACQRFREGSDIQGLEMVSALVGNTTAAYIMVQISGRSLRIDYANKEGWCHIVRPSVDGTTEQDVYDSILLDVFEFLNTTNKKYERHEIERLVRTYLGDADSIAKKSSITETIQRLQAIYVRREYQKRTPKEQYGLVREINKELGLTSKTEYIERASQHSKFIQDPNNYFKDLWVCWYHFLGIDTSKFPQTKAEWISISKEIGLTSWDEYKQKRTASLPANPGEMYDDYTNWDKEFAIEEEIVW